MDSILDTAFSALSDPTRRAILARLAQGEATVNELVEPFELSQPTISKHIKVLEKAGLVSRSRDAQRRPCRLETTVLDEIDHWLESYRTVMQSNYARLDGVLDEMSSTQRITKKQIKRGRG